jgi:3-hydroxybutyryl-CoA dehydrogenase
MGPCELMDLIGHDTNFAVTQSVYEANFFDKRYVPSPVQRELVAGGWLGRKSGRGFYVHGDAKAPAATVPAAARDASPPQAAVIVLHGKGRVVERWVQAVAQAGRAVSRDEASTWTGLEADGSQLRLTDGRPAALAALQDDGVRDLALFDLSLTDGGPLAWCASASASPSWQSRAPQWLAAAGFVPQRIADAPGLVVARTIAMLINEAADAVQQGVCTPEAADSAMKLGVNYPAGPFEWLAGWDAREVVRLLDHLDAHYRGERYRVSPELRQRAWARS